MDQAITTLKELPGVFGVCVYDTNNKLIINQMPPFFPAGTLAGLGSMLTDIISLTRMKLTNASDLTLHYDEISLIVRALTDKTILVLGEPHMNERMVSYSLNMLGKPSQTAEGKSTAAPTAGAEPSGPGNIIGPYISELKNLLTKVVGPMADIIFDDALESWQKQGTALFTEFLQILQKEINNDEQYERYLELAEKELSEIQDQEKTHG